VPRASSPSRGGADVRREHTKGPCSRKVSRFASRCLLFTRRRWQRARSSSSVSSCTASTEWSVVQRGSGEGRTPSNRRRSTTGTSEVRSRCRRGKKTPTPRRTGSPVHEDLRSSTIHRSVHRGVKPRSTSGPRKRRRVVPQSSALEIPRTHERRVFVSTVWMAEVGP